MPIRDVTELTKKKAATARPLPETPEFAYYIAPDSVTADGRYLPRKIPLEPGLQNIKDVGEYATMDGYQKRLDRVMVPHDFPCVAWGEKRTGYMRVDEGTDRNGKVLKHHFDCWTRYVTLGGSRRTEFDHEGWDQFRSDVEKVLHPDTREPVGPPSELAVKIERARVQASIHSHARLERDSPSHTPAREALESKLKPRSKRASASA